MNAGRLDKDLISQPELWKLALLVADDRMDVGLFPPVTRQEIIWRTFNFDPNVPDRLRAIEDIIYDNPLLFSDFKRVDCIIDNVAEIPLPASLTAAEAAECYALQTSAETPVGEPSDERPDAFSIELYPTPDPATRIALCQKSHLKAFFTRTFYNIRFDSRLSALCRYISLARQQLADTTAAYAIIRGHRLTLIIFSNGRLLTANNFRFSKPTDALYYILSSAALLKLDPLTLPLYFTATPADDNMTQLLTQHIPSAQPLPFPMLRYRASKETLQAPLELITRPLCE